MTRPLHIIGFTLFTALLAKAPDADASTCTRWVNQLGPCDILPLSICNQPTSSWSDANWRTYLQWIYADSAQQACYKQVLKTSPTDADTAVADAAHGYVCAYDSNDNGVVDASDYSSVGSGPMFSDNGIVREPVCDLVPKGPYAGMNPGTTPAPGLQFVNRAFYKSANTSRNGGVLRSDAGPSSPPSTTPVDSSPLNIDPHNALAWQRSSTINPDDPDVTATTYPGDPSSAEIDHIIPRVDVSGCPCGPNSSANALVISRQLNGSMSNHMNNPNRIAILRKYTNYTQVFGAPTFPDDETLTASNALDEEGTGATEPELTGGCSAGGGASGAGGVLVLGLLVGRRRRY